MLGLLNHLDRCHQMDIWIVRASCAQNRCPNMGMLVAGFVPYMSFSRGFPLTPTPKIQTGYQKDVRASFWGLVRNFQTAWLPFSPMLLIPFFFANGFERESKTKSSVWTTQMACTMKTTQGSRPSARSVGGSNPGLIGVIVKPIKEIIIMLHAGRT